MTNPFEKYKTGTYAGHIYQQIRSLNVDESIKIEMADKTIEVFRMTVKYLAKKHDVTFETRQDEEKNMWVKRTS